MVKKFKLQLDPRVEVREGDGKWRDPITPLDDLNALDESMLDAGWSDDPGTGRAVLLADGREVVNPIPVAPPLSISRNTEPSVNDLVERAFKRHFEQLKADEEIDSLEDHDDFGEDEDWQPTSMFEVLIDEAPGVKPAPVSDEVRSDLEQLEQTAVAAAPKKKGGKQPAQDEEEGA